MWWSLTPTQYIFSYSLSIILIPTMPFHKLTLSLNTQCCLKQVKIRIMWSMLTYRVSEFLVKQNGSKRDEKHVKKKTYNINSSHWQCAAPPGYEPFDRPAFWCMIGEQHHHHQRHIKEWLCVVLGIHACIQVCVCGQCCVCLSQYSEAWGTAAC